MYRIYNWLIWFFLALTTSVPASADTSTLRPGLVNPGYQARPVWFKASFLDIREDAAEAKEAGKRVILYFYQDGCPYCRKLLQENLAQPEIVTRMKNNFDTIAINMWGDREVTGFQGEATTEKKFTASLKVMFTPTLLFLNENHQVVLRINGYYPPPKFLAALQYVAGQHEQKMLFRDYFASLLPTFSKAIETTSESYFLRPPHDVNSVTNKPKPLLVLFEEAACEPCQELHNDILKRPETQHWLQKFQVVQLTIGSSTLLTIPGGERITAAAWARKLKIQYVPSLLFFDGSAREVFRIEAYLKAFHIQSAMAYVAEKKYLVEPNFQRYIAARANTLEAQGVHIDIMK